MKLTVFGKIMAAVMLAAVAVFAICGCEIAEGVGAHYTALWISGAVALILAIAFNLERRR